MTTPEQEALDELSNAAYYGYLASLELGHDTTNKNAYLRSAHEALARAESFAPVKNLDPDAVRAAEIEGIRRGEATKQKFTRDTTDGHIR
ncbi:MAG: hypothetical protein ACOYJ2_01395 [Rickettsiales bacterium]